jgi:outer membrane lipoprotein SlyB
MDNHANASKSPHTLFWIAGIAVTVFSAAGIAAIMGWIPSSTCSPAEEIAVTRPAAAPASPAVATAQPATAQNRELARTQAREEDRAEARRDARQAKAQAAARCAECGVIESVREIVAKGEGSGLGAVGGAAVGGLLGNQIGDGSGRRIATVVGAVGGAVAGHQIEKHVKSGTSYEITVRLEDGSSRVISQASAPTWRSGDRVKIVNGVIESNA